MQKHTVQYGTKISNLLKKGFDSVPAYNNKCIKTKLKSYNGKTNTNFHANKTPEEVVHCARLCVMFIESAVKIGEKHHHETFIEECKYTSQE